MFKTTPEAFILHQRNNPLDPKLEQLIQACIIPIHRSEVRNWALISKASKRRKFSNLLKNVGQEDSLERLVPRLQPISKDLLFQSANCSIDFNTIFHERPDSRQTSRRRFDSIGVSPCVGFYKRPPKTINKSAHHGKSSIAQLIGISLFIPSVYQQLFSILKDYTCILQEIKDYVDKKANIISGDEKSLNQNVSLPILTTKDETILNKFTQTTDHLTRVTYPANSIPADSFENFEWHCPPSMYQTHYQNYNENCLVDAIHPIKPPIPFVRFPAVKYTPFPPTNAFQNQCNTNTQEGKNIRDILNAGSAL